MPNSPSNPSAPSGSNPTSNFGQTLGPDGKVYSYKGNPDGSINWFGDDGVAVDVFSTIGKYLKDNAPALINAAGSVISARETAAQTAAKIAEQKAEFEVTSKQQAARDAQAAAQYARTQGDTEGNTAVGVQGEINRAPLADKAQALLLARMGVQPGAFQPRDYTQGLSNLSKPFTAPGANVATAMQAAAANYQPGQGGVDTSTAQALLAKLKSSAGLSGQSPTTPPATGTGPRDTPFAQSQPDAKIPNIQTVNTTLHPNYAVATQPTPSSDPNDPNAASALLLKRMQYA